MKKLILVFAVCLTSASTFAQNNIQNSNQYNQQSRQDDNMHEDGIVMKDGKLMLIKNGEKTAMTQNEISLTDGTIVKKDGTIIRKDGTRTPLNNGEHISMLGKVSPMDKGHKNDDKKNDNRRNNDGNQMNQNQQRTSPGSNQGTTPGQTPGSVPSSSPKQTQ